MKETIRSKIEKEGHFSGKEYGIGTSYKWDRSTKFTKGLPSRYYLSKIEYYITRDDPPEQTQINIPIEFFDLEDIEKCIEKFIQLEEKCELQL